MQECHSDGNVLFTFLRNFKQTRTRKLKSYEKTLYYSFRINHAYLPSNGAGR